MAFIPHFSAGIRLERIAPGLDRRAWTSALQAFDPATTQVLKIDDRAGVWRTNLAGHEVVLKMWEYPTLGARIKLLVRASRAWRHWRGARWLMDHGFPTAAPLALFTEYGPGGPREWLAMEFLKGPTVLDHLRNGDLTLSREHALAEALAGQVSDMVARGRFNRDHKPSNLIITGWDGESPRIAVIDSVAIRRCRRFDFGAMQRMLASLYIEPLGLDHPPRRTLCMRALSAIRARDWWPLLARAIREHGDPRPRMDPGRSC